jgi:hypothetical protein
MASRPADPDADADGAAEAVGLALGLGLGEAGALPQAATMSAATVDRVIDR